MARNSQKAIILHTFGAQVLPFLPWGRGSLSVRDGQRPTRGVLVGATLDDINPALT